MRSFLVSILVTIFYELIQNRPGLPREESLGASATARFYKPDTFTLFNKQL